MLDGRSDIGVLFLSYAVIESTKQKATRCIERVAAAVSLDRAYNFPVVLITMKVGSQGKATKLRDITNLYNRSRPEPLQEFGAWSLRSVTRSMISGAKQTLPENGVNTRSSTAIFIEEA